MKTFVILVIALNLVSLHVALNGAELLLAEKATWEASAIYQCKESGKCL